MSSRFPGASPIRSNTVCVGLEPGKGNLLQHRSCGPVVAHRLRIQVRSDFFSPVSFCMRVCNLHANGY